MDGVTALVLAGGRVDELGALTARRAKAAVPFGGTYRIIDFPFSNLAQSGICRVGVLSQYRPSSLMDHVGMGQAWGLVGREREVRVLPPYQAATRVDWYNGTADAVLQNRSFWKDARDVLIVSGDHIYAMDYRPFLEHHRATGAALTMAFKHFARSELTSYGVGVVDRDGRVTGYAEKPAAPASDLGSLTIYAFDRALLDSYLDRGRPADGLHQFYDHVIPAMVERENVQGYVFDGYWAYTRSVDQYYQASMDLLDPASGLNLDAWDIRTNVDETGAGGSPPFLIGDGARVRGSRISSGCRIEGEVTESVLSPGVIVEPGAAVRRSVLMNNVKIRAGTILDRVIVDKHTEIGAGSRLGGDGPCPFNEALSDTHTCGAVVIGRECVLPPKSDVGRNTQIAPGTEREWPFDLPAGASVDTPEVHG